MKKPTYMDCAKITEDQRIDLIGHAVMDLKKATAFMVEDDGKKAERYITKLKAKFPGIVVVSQFHGPVPGVVTVKVAPLEPPVKPENN